MKLSELFEEMPKVTIGGEEHELVFGTRARLQTINDYGSAEKVHAVAVSMMNGVGIEDLVNFLYACLLNGKKFKSKDELIDKIDRATSEEMAVYADAVFGSWMKASITKEQLDKLEVINAQSESKKKNVTTL